MSTLAVITLALVFAVLVFGIGVAIHTQSKLHTIHSVCFKEASKHFLKLEIEKIEYEQRQRSSRSTNRHS